MESEIPQYSSLGKLFLPSMYNALLTVKKRVGWVSYYNKGGSRDSSCLRDTKFYSILESTKYELYQLGYFILGDSVYTIDSFLLPPYGSSPIMTSEDYFNLLYSSARIIVEYAFGEINLRLGIFWKILTCSLKNTSLIIEGSVRLHNFLMDYREAHKVSDEESNEK